MALLFDKLENVKAKMGELKCKQIQVIPFHCTGIVATNSVYNSFLFCMIFANVVLECQSTCFGYRAV